MEVNPLKRRKNQKDSRKVRAQFLKTPSFLGRKKQSVKEKIFAPRKTLKARKKNC